MTAPWWDSPMICFDTETTGVDVETARIVTASCIVVGPEGIAGRHSWLADPGVEIPAEAAAVHGISTLRARAEGRPAADVLDEIRQVIDEAWWDWDEVPLVAMNASFDLTILQRELVRHGQDPILIGPVLDPLVIDRACVPFRRGKGARTLTALAAAYGVRLDGAHAADEDALTAGRVVWRQARVHEVLRQMDLTEMQTWQADQHRAWAHQFQDYLRRSGSPDAVIDSSWPVRLAPVAQEGASA